MRLGLGKVVEGEEDWGEEEVAHKLRLNGETGGMWKPKGIRSATSAEQSDTTVDAEDVE